MSIAGLSFIYGSKIIKITISALRFQIYFGSERSVILLVFQSCYHFKSSLVPHSGLSALSGLFNIELCFLVSFIIGFATTTILDTSVYSVIPSQKKTYQLQRFLRFGRNDDFSTFRVFGVSAAKNQISSVFFG